MKVFIALADKGTLKAASQHMGVNSSTIWRRIQQLEQQLSTQLFIVGRRGYTLTEAGLSVLEKAKHMESLADNILVTSAERHRHIKGLIRLTAPANMATQTLPLWISEFRRTYPDVEFEIIESEQTLDIEFREADIAIRASHIAPDNLIARKIRDIHLSICASKTYLQSRGYDPSLGLKELNRLAAIDYIQLDNPAVRWYQKKIKHNPRSIACNSISTALNAALNDQGVALLPSDACQDLVELHKLDEKYSSAMWLMANKDLRNTARIKAFWEFLMTKIESCELQELPSEK